MVPPALQLRENTRGRRQGQRDDDNEEMMVAVVLCAYIMATVTTAAVAATTTSLHEAPREAPGYYRRPNLRYLHDHAQDASLFKRKYRMDRASFDKLVRLLMPHLKRGEHFAGMLVPNLGTIHNHPFPLQPMPFVRYQVQSSR